MKETNWGEEFNRITVSFGHNKGNIKLGDVEKAILTYHNEVKQFIASTIRKEQIAMIDKVVGGEKKIHSIMEADKFYYEKTGYNDCINAIKQNFNKYIGIEEDNYTGETKYIGK